MKQYLLYWTLRKLVICISLLGFFISSFAQAQPVLTSFSPASGPIGTTVTIVGKEFNATLANNVVFFGAVRAIVQSVVGTTSLVVTVPSGANYQCISVINLGTNLIGNSASPFVVTYFPIGDDSFRPGAVFTNDNSTFTRQAVIGDMNRDGKPDFVVANSDGTVSVFSNQITSTLAIASFSSPVVLGRASSFRDAAAIIGDFDGDGWLDIASVNSGINMVSIYRNITHVSGVSPKFATAATFITGANPVAINAGDLDGDGKADLVITGSMTWANVYILRNTSRLGLINFAGFQIFSAGVNPDAVAIGDLDKDGKPDVVVSNNGSYNVSVFHNNSSIGNIRLARPSTLALGAHPIAVAIADFDGDTWLDVATANSCSASVFLNKSSSGMLNFASKVDFSTGNHSSPRCLSIGDLNGDGKPDMVIASVGNNKVPILQNTSTVGALSFSTNNSLVSTHPLRAAVGDLNGDGKPDIVIGNDILHNNITVFLQRVTQSLTITSASIIPLSGTLTATVISSAPVGQGGPITFAVSAGSGSATVNPKTGLIKAISTGTIILTVTAAGDTNYTRATTSQLITVGKSTTPILVITSPNTLNVDGTLTATVSTTATGSKGGVISFSIVAGSGSATINPTTGLITGVGAGTVILIASSAANINYNSSSASQTIIIGRSTPTLLLTSANTLGVDGTLTVTISTTASHGIGAISYSMINGTGAAIVNANTGLVTGFSSGTVILTITSAGNTDYASASISKVIIVHSSTPTLTIVSKNTVAVGGALTAVVNTTATFGRGGAIYFAISPGSGSATVDAISGLITGIGVGTVNLIASSVGDMDYNPSSTSQLIAIESTALTSVVMLNPILQENNLSLAKTTNTTISDNTASINTGTGELVDQQIIVPEAFSPNGDGVGDLFDIQNVSKYPDNEFIVANRSGEAVFKVHGYNNETVTFAGRSNTGAELVGGLYYYTLVLYDHGKSSKYAGYFELKR